jgi:hypothetical protein
MRINTVLISNRLQAGLVGRKGILGNFSIAVGVIRVRMPIRFSCRLTLTEAHNSFVGEPQS